MSELFNVCRLKHLQDFGALTVSCIVPLDMSLNRKSLTDVCLFLCLGSNPCRALELIIINSNGASKVRLLSPRYIGIYSVYCDTTRYGRTPSVVAEPVWLASLVSSRVLFFNIIFPVR